MWSGTDTEKFSETNFQLLREGDGDWLLISLGCDDEDIEWQILVSELFTIPGYSVPTMDSENKIKHEFLPSGIPADDGTIIYWKVEKTISENSSYLMDEDQWNDLEVGDWFLDSNVSPAKFVEITNKYAIPPNEFYPETTYYVSTKREIPTLYYSIDNRNWNLLNIGT